MSLGRTGPAWSMRLPLLWLSTGISTATLFKARWSSLVVEGQQQHGHGQLERTPEWCRWLLQRRRRLVCSSSTMTLGDYRKRRTSFAGQER